ncbi:hypothetical protein GYMLUDRAFT_38334 [Collybiopsis luxurians FD-317 M1]|nr:hypothetical protein GYMLUDRAFT_38334 [Collybiopsis luxurians FD-317 M1]
MARSVNEVIFLMPMKRVPSTEEAGAWRRVWHRETTFGSLQSTEHSLDVIKISCLITANISIVSANSVILVLFVFVIAGRCHAQKFVSLPQNTGRPRRNCIAATMNVLPHLENLPLRNLPVSLFVKFDHCSVSLIRRYISLFTSITMNVLPLLENLPVRNLPVSLFVKFDHCSVPLTRRYISLFTSITIDGSWSSSVSRFEEIAPF